MARVRYTGPEPWEYAQANAIQKCYFGCLKCTCLDIYVGLTKLARGLTVCLTTLRKRLLGVSSGVLWIPGKTSQNPLCRGKETDQTGILACRHMRSLSREESDPSSGSGHSLMPEDVAWGRVAYHEVDYCPVIE